MAQREGGGGGVLAEAAALGDGVGDCDGARGRQRWCSAPRRRRRRREGRMDAARGGGGSGGSVRGSGRDESEERA